MQAGFASLARPLIAVLNGTANRLLTMVGVQPTEELQSARTPDELSLLVRQSADRGAMHSPTRAATAAVPKLQGQARRGRDDSRVQVRFLAAAGTAADVLTAARVSGYSRFPVIDGSQDDIVGLVHVKSAVAVPVAQRARVEVRDLSRYDCDYTIGLLSQVPVLFGLPKAAVAHDSCQVRGAAECRYELTWRRRTPLDRFRRQRAGPPAAAREVEALRDKLAALQHATADLVSSEDLDAVLPRIALQASSAVCAQRYLLTVRLNGDSEPRVHSDGFSVDAAHTLGVALLDDPDAPAAAGFSALVADVVSARANHGRLAAFFPVGQPFFSAEQDLLNAYARLAAAALDATAALAAARERGRTAEALLALASSLARAEQHHEIAQVVARAALAVTGADRAAVLLRDPMSGAVTVRSDTAANDTATNDTAADATDPLAVADAQAQELSELLTAGRGPGLYPPGTADPLSHCVRHALAASDGSMLAVAPVMANGDLLGAVAVLCPTTRPGLPGAPLLARLCGLADQASTALVNASLVAQVRHEATHDALTGLANRRLFLERVERDLEACRRRGGRLAVLFIDLDRFKAVNDDLGHAAGDELLRQFAGRLRASVRSGDLVARAGGDEFTVLLPSVTGDDEVEAVAARIVVACAEPFRIAGHQLTVTPSVGAAVSPRDGSTGTALMSGADAAMYEAKHAGRNTYRTLLRG